MLLKNPVIITPRLLPGVKVGDAFLSIEYDGITRDNRDRYKIYLDAPNLTHEDSELQSGCGGGTLQDGLANLLGFMFACGESVQWGKRTGKLEGNADLYPPDVAAWCADNASELSMLCEELSEKEGLIKEGLIEE
jgi:hypothetical protein